MQLLDYRSYSSFHSSTSKAVKIISDNTTELSSIILTREDSIQRHLKYLDVSNGNLQTVRSKAFDNMKILVNYYSKLKVCINYLLLNNNRIKNLEPNAFSLLDELKHLDLSNNNLSFINNDFENLKNLDLLNLSNNNISYINLTAIYADNINLSNNNLSDISIVDIEKDWSSINLSFNKLTSMPLVKNSRINELDISNNKLQSLNATFISESDIKHLNASNNQIHEFKITEIIQSLTVLDLSFNNFSEFTSSNFSKLKHLNLSDNYFEFGK